MYTDMLRQNESEIGRASQTIRRRAQVYIRKNGNFENLLLIN